LGHAGCVILENSKYRRCGCHIPRSFITRNEALS
jgi:hypothetical protein